MDLPKEDSVRVGEGELRKTLGTADLVEGGCCMRKRLAMQDFKRTLDTVGAIAIEGPADKVVADAFDALA